MTEGDWTVVFDTNVLVSALQFGKPGSVPREALNTALQRCTLATSQEQEAELARILTTKFDWQLNKVEDALGFILQRSIRVELIHTIHLCRDPADDMFLECADLTKAQYLVAGDKDLLVLGSYGETKILTPHAFLKLF